MARFTGGAVKLARVSTERDGYYDEILHYQRHMSSVGLKYSF